MNAVALNGVSDQPLGGDPTLRSTSRSMPDATALKRILRGTFGLRNLREGQEAVISSVLRGEPTLAIMPTGAGKSLCYQLAALALPGMTIVASPLIALMKDQCDKLRDMGIEACQFNSGISANERSAAEEAILTRTTKIVFTTPERLANPAFVDLISDQQVSLFVIDEAHCISQWGHDFRPAFLEVGQALARLGRPRILALTATATQPIIDDIAAQLGVRQFEIVNTGTYRENLHYHVTQVTNDADKLDRAVAIACESNGSGLIYTATIKAAETVHAALIAAGVEAVIYHGRVGLTQRREAQDAFMSGRARVMVATNAFGLGIDKPDTRFVLHYQMPAGLDAYYQESGRAGRDGAPADCTLLFLYADRAVQQFFLAGKYPSREDLIATYTALQSGRDDGHPWTLERLEAALDVSKTKLQVALRLLRSQKVALMASDGSLTLTRHGLGDPALERLLEGYRAKREADRAMLEEMVFFAQTGRCRWKVLLDHFGEALDADACGSCDNCRRIAAANETAGRAASVAPDVAGPAPAATPLRQFAPGDAVLVPRYGQGIVDAIDAVGVTVVFADNHRRMFLATFVRHAPASTRSRRAGLARAA